MCHRFLPIPIYRYNRYQSMVQGNLSQSLNLDFGVPQGSCLGPLLFTISASKLFDVIKVHPPTVHCYADDTQLYVSFSPNISTGQFKAVTPIYTALGG